MPTVNSSEYITPKVYGMKIDATIDGKEHYDKMV